MRTLSSILAVTAILALVVPANAGTWVDKTARWTDPAYGGLTAGGRLITDTANDTLYYMSGTSLKQYNSATDSWTDMASAIGVGYRAGDPYGSMWYAEGKLLLKDKNASYIEIYDIANNTWTQSSHPLGSNGVFAYGQGAPYNSQTGQFLVFWSGTVDGAWKDLMCASYDVATGTWGEATEYNYWDDGHWRRMESVNVGNYNYVVEDSDAYIGRYIQAKITDLTAAGFPDGLTVAFTSTHDLGEGNALALDGSGSGFGVQCMAVYGTDIYFTGMDKSGACAVYHTTTDTWDDIESFANGDYGWRDHSTAVQDATLYVQDNAEFFAYAIPEPATMSLIGFGGLGLLFRRKK